MWQELKDKIQSEAPRYNLNNSTSSNQTKIKSPSKTKNKYKECQKHLSMYSPFLWRNAKGQSKSIIKRRRRWRTPKPCQICSQTSNLIQNVHQNLSLSRLNGQDMIQRTSNVGIIQSSRWRNISSSSSTRVLAAPVKEGGGGTLLEDAPWETEGSALKWAAL